MRNLGARQQEGAGSGGMRAGGLCGRLLLRCSVLPELPSVPAWPGSSFTASHDGAAIRAENFCGDFEQKATSVVIHRAEETQFLGRTLPG